MDDGPAAAAHDASPEETLKCPVVLIALLKILPHISSRRETNEAQPHGFLHAQAQDGHIVTHPPVRNSLCANLILIWSLVSEMGCHTNAPE